MKCGKCETEFEGKFCPKCGEKAETATENQENNAVQTAPAVNTAVNYTVPDKPKAFYYITIPISIIIVILAATLFGWGIASSPKTVAKKHLDSFLKGDFSYIIDNCIYDKDLFVGAIKAEYANEYDSDDEIFEYFSDTYETKITSYDQIIKEACNKINEEYGLQEIFDKEYVYASDIKFNKKYDLSSIKVKEINEDFEEAYDNINEEFEDENIEPVEYKPIKSATKVIFDVTFINSESKKTEHEQISVIIVKSDGKDKLYSIEEKEEEVNILELYFESLLVELI